MDFKILDCTLRDGGYLNNWNFSTEDIISIVNALENNFIEKIEIGYIDKVKNIDFLINNLSHRAEYFFMINFSETLNINTINELGIRLAFKKNHLKQLSNYIKLFRKLYLQAMYINFYSKEELFYLIDICNSNDNIKALYIVDSLGSLLPKNINNYYSILDERLKSNISIGLHLHNNNNLALLNIMEVLNKKSDRNIIIDSTLSGLGRGGGNIKTEVLLLLRNKLNIVPLLEVYENILLKEFKHIKKDIIHFLTGIYSVHQNYSDKFLNYSLIEIQNIFKNMKYEEKINFNSKIF
ncbi:MAG: hypothetical protein KatS3mg068_2019 [Candidatus Sericytochromatia bacterium]|nr:MAG: hypothetical protein KatS3mg068_2019 [Candidatus Sericytochromatia bacterium]